MINAPQSTPDVTDDSVAALAAAAVAGNRGALARAITEVERASAFGRAILSRLEERIQGRTVVGMTGPPGAGKSTLVNALVTAWRQAGERVAVIAVDPSSSISHGAILGDRIRMTSALDDDDVFVRSLASQGHLGGMSPAAVRIIDVFDAAGYDKIIIETVGTGQSEIDVAEISDVTVVISAPGLGDDIQAMKSGLLEIADILVVNKADLPGAEQALQQLKGAVSIRSNPARTVPVLKASGLRHDGVGPLAEAIETKLALRARESTGSDRRRRRARYLVGHVAGDILRRKTRTGSASRSVEALADGIVRGEMALEDAARQLLQLAARETD